MKITKLGHCAMVVEENGVKLLTDPGNFTEAQNSLTGLDGIVITHEHADHFHIESVKEVLKNNPAAIVITNSAVAAIMQKEGIGANVQIAGDGQSADVKGIKIEGFGKDHALVYPPNMGLCENTGYLIGSKLYFPGDNFHNPQKKVDVLALPVAGPWMKIAEAVDFAKAIQARVAFGVHDGMVTPSFRPFVGRLLQMFVPGTEYVSLADGESREF